MSQEKFIPTQTLCVQYNIEIAFVEDLQKVGLIQLEVYERKQCIHKDEIGHLEKIIRLHYELKVNLEGIDVVLNLLEKERLMRDELTILRNRLSLYENR